MADTTANRGYPYPETSDSFLPHSDIEALAEALDTDMHTQVGRISQLETIAWQPFEAVAWSTTTADSAAIGTTETAVVTLASTTYAAHTTYMVEIQGALTMSTSTSFSAWKVRKTNASGTILLEWPRTPVIGHTNDVEVPLRNRFFQVGASDVTTVLVLTLASSSSSTTNHAGNSTYPRGLFIYTVGADTYSPGAVVLS